MTSSEALVVSGGARFSDPWHPFDDTSGHLAAVLAARGTPSSIVPDADRALAGLADGPLPALLVLNFGWYGPDRLTDAATDSLVTALDAGLPTLLLHSTLTAFPDWPVWHQLAGGGWTYGSTYHPDYAPGTATPDPEHSLTHGLGVLEIIDERYTGMWVAETSSVFLTHEEAGVRHPLGWVRTWGPSPIVADALGHDLESYHASGRQVLLERELDWLLAPRTHTSTTPPHE